MTGSASTAILVIALAAFGAPARAQQLQGSVAQGLFEQGRVLMRENRLDRACPMLAESLRLDPAIGTRLNLALCHEREGKAATAYVEYNDALSQAIQEHDQERELLCRQRINTLEPLLIRVRIHKAFEDPSGFWITLDGVRLERAALEAALPVNPGLHRIVYGAPGYRRAQLSFSLTEPATRREIALQPLVRAPRPARSQRAVSVPAHVPLRRFAAGACLGGSLVALGFGAYFGLKAGTEWEQRNQHCPGGRCDVDAKHFGDDAQRLAILSDVGFGLALASAGVGVYLLVARPHGKPESSALRIVTLPVARGASVALEGAL